MLVEARGIASAVDAWLRFTTPATWSVWAPLIRSVDASHDELVAGATGRVHGPPGVAVDFEVTRVDPVERTWSWRAGRGPTSVSMDHHVVPAAGGGARAFLRVPGRSAPLLQPYRVPASAALRGLVRDRSGLGGEEDPVQVFDFAFTRAYAAAARPFGITSRSSSVELGPQWLYVRDGAWRLLTPRSNIASAEVTGDFDFHRTAGPPRLSLTDRGVSFTSNGDRALCLRFHEPVPAIDPTATITHPGATLSVADPEALAAALPIPYDV